MPITSLQPHEPPAAKRLFANRALHFANRVRSLAGIRIYPVAASVAILVLTVAGAFGTGAMPLAQRLAFWALLIGFNTLIWILWFAWRVRDDRDWWRAAMVGIFVVNLPMPAEISLCLNLVGGNQPAAWSGLWLHAGLISVALFILMLFVVRSAPAPNQSESAHAKGLLWRSGHRDFSSLAGISAEDHYCRIWRNDGNSQLVHARFADLMAEVAGMDGAIVRRGHWLASAAVAGITRNDRRWEITTSDGRTLRVSSRAAGALRERGWLGRNRA